MLKITHESIFDKSYLLSETYKKLTRPEKVTVIKKRCRRQLNKKVARPGKPWVWRVGYNSCTGQWVSSETVPLVSGSSANRKKPKKRPPSPKSFGVLHEFSTRSRAKCRDKTTAFFRTIFKDRVFLTLSFIQHLTDREGVKILNKFLTVLRKDNPKVEYCWIAEHQKKNRDRIHFHIVLNQRLPIRRYNALWTLQQYNSGLIGQSKKGEIVSAAEFAEIYSRDEVHKHFNPADVRKAYSINGLADYLTAYVTKQDQGEKYGCLTWHCSRKVSRLFTREITGPSCFAYLLSFKNRRLNFKTGEIFEAQPCHRQFFSSVKVLNKAAVLSRMRGTELVNKWVMEGLEIRGPDDIPKVDVEKYLQLYE